jgi:AmmeMemoRadiSam system protein A
MSYDYVLTDDEKRELLRIARATLREFMRSGRIPPGKPHRASLTAPAGVFVTLHRGPELRGCIGTLQATTPLYRIIQEMVIAAASRDARFAPIAEGEVDQLNIEISVLGGARRIHDAGEVVIGEQGVCVSRGERRGLLLPQVAVEHDWDAATFLDRACEKGGLPAGAWRDPEATVEVFGAQVFDDAAFPPANGARR